ncbi:transaldolase [Helicobacter monodelphidis]|uniref:transaldolase n=1 Tax=Helicobacter sp. 15-1451 TaxID=2004995 RepID=UPI000DCD278E|nr:transaldolase [Helicobacter sp. 15-1451]RAX57531.1 transaldolase [Helicobacter sp. 15-1451]
MNFKEGCFSLWCDFIERSFLIKGFSQLLQKESIKGATSNPAIFQKAFSSPAYKEDMKKLFLQDLSTKNIYESLAVEDIKNAATILEPLFIANPQDGWVSIEVDPYLCDDAEATYAEARRLHQAINKPNVMIKVPATKAGFIAMEELFATNISVNATLIFNENQAKQCVEAFERGFKRSMQKKDLQAVVSIFVSRFDRKCDSKLPDALKAKIGIMNATKIYHTIESYSLPYVRSLFASTGVKDSSLPASYYVDSLLYPNSINTAPLETIAAFCATGKNQVNNAPKVADSFWQEVARAEIDMTLVSEELLQEGLDAFKESFKAILEGLESEF